MKYLACNPIDSQETDSTDSPESVQLRQESRPDVNSHSSNECLESVSNPFPPEQMVSSKKGKSIHNPSLDSHRKGANYTRVEVGRENNGFEGVLQTLQPQPSCENGILCADVRVLGTQSIFQKEIDKFSFGGFKFMTYRQEEICWIIEELARKCEKALLELDEFRFIEVEEIRQKLFALDGGK